MPCWCCGWRSAQVFIMRVLSAFCLETRNTDRVRNVEKPEASGTVAMTRLR